MRCENCGIGFPRVRSGGVEEWIGRRAVMERMGSLAGKLSGRAMRCGDAMGK